MNIRLNNLFVAILLGLAGFSFTLAYPNAEPIIEAEHIAKICNAASDDAIGCMIKAGF